MAPLKVQRGSMNFQVASRKVQWGHLSFHVTPLKIQRTDYGFAAASRNSYQTIGSFRGVVEPVLFHHAKRPDFRLEIGAFKLKRAVG